MDMDMELDREDFDDVDSQSDVSEMVRMDSKALLSESASYQ